MQDWDVRFRQAEERKRARKEAARGEQGLTRIGGTKSELRLPDEVFARLGGKPTREEALWRCDACQESPEPCQYVNGFVPRKCSCQLAQIQRQQEEQHRLALWRHQQDVARVRCAKCYTWLGDEGGSFGLDEKTFDTFDMDFQEDGFYEATQFAQHPSGNLILWSDESWGTGKTHLAAAICNFLLAKHTSCRFTTAQGLFDAFASRMDDRQGYSDLLREAGTTPLLVIDDLDKVHLTAFKQGVFFDVLNQRNLRHLPTVITTNARVEIVPNDVIGISTYIGKPAASRLCDRGNGGLTVVEMNGADYRRHIR